MSNIKPCPFPSCGSSNVSSHGLGCFTVTCLDCGANGPIVGLDARTPTEAIKEAEQLWNERGELVNGYMFTDGIVALNVREMTDEEAVLLGIKKGNEDV